MGEAKRRRAAQTAGLTFEAVDAKLRALGVDVSQFEFYDQPAFVAHESSDPLALELYSSWVVSRPRDQAYDATVREVVPKLARLVERRLSAAQGLGACAGVATMMARMLDRLGVWSFAARGSLTIEVPGGADVQSRYFPDCDLVGPDEIAGHAWLVAPPFVVIDPTILHQKWVDLDPLIHNALPKVVMSELGTIIRPRWDDVLSDSVVRKAGLSTASLDSSAVYRLHPDLARVERILPGREIREGLLALRYFASAVTVSEHPLERMPSVLEDTDSLVPIEFWRDVIAPAFGVVS